MAGNTKLKGFQSNNRVTLERWGKEATVELPGPAIEVLREACFRELPSSPAEPKPAGDIGFDERSGRISFSLTADDTRIFLAYLESAPDHALEPPALALSQALKVALADYERYYDTQDEPGVDSAP